MKKRLVWLVLLPIVAVLLMASGQQSQEKAAADFPVRNGHWYTQASPAVGEGFRITDDGGAHFWSEYQAQGGAAALGYPISRRFLCEQDLCQATEHAILRWHVQDGEGSFSTASLSGELTRLGYDDNRAVAQPVSALAKNSGLIPPAAQLSEAAADAEMPDLPALSKQAAEIAGDARGAVVQIVLGPDEFGSGVIVDRRGYVLTNQHVVEGFSRTMVVLPDGRRLKGTVVGSDELADVAVVKIDAGNLPTLPVGDSDSVVVGDEIVLLGYSPTAGSGPTARTGVVRAAGSIAGHEGMPEVIQTDAFVHPGDSGGPLLNLRGEMIGMNEAMIGSHKMRGYLLSFALSSNDVRTASEGILHSNTEAEMAGSH